MSENKTPDKQENIPTDPVEEADCELECWSDG